MNVRCTRKKDSFKNLTVNANYEAIEEGDSFIITNDAGYRAKYAKEYFRVNSEEAARAARVERPARPVVRTILEVAQITVTRDGGIVDANIVIPGVGRRSSITLSISGTTISCGVYQLQGISGLKGEISRIIASLPNTVTGTKGELMTMVMERMMAYIREQWHSMCYLISDTISEEESDMNDILTAMCDTAIRGNNPNSGNDIIVWVMK